MLSGIRAFTPFAPPRFFYLLAYNYSQIICIFPLVFIRIMGQIFHVCAYDITLNLRKKPTVNILLPYRWKKQEQ